MITRPSIPSLAIAIAAAFALVGAATTVPASSTSDRQGSRADQRGSLVAYDANDGALRFEKTIGGRSGASATVVYADFESLFVADQRCQSDDRGIERVISLFGFSMRRLGFPVGLARMPSFRAHAFLAMELAGSICHQAPLRSRAPGTKG